ncbi:sigma-70 family RNA polymerase sigma factor, partial [Dysgonomonas sp. Marseille-P4677]|uniref:RNA polymerase sigma factor n=1 Tax=Dysgonomonas sp. Marseille-P4677 TaxID=2364790 RepID=UPI001912347A
HDIFCKIFVNKNELKNIQNIKYYLFRSLKNRLIDVSRRKSEQSKDSLDNYTFSVEVSVVDMMIDDEERLFLENRVKYLMEKLTSNQREAIYLRYMEEMEYEEIALLLNINPESVRKLVYRGIDKLREHSTLSIALILSVYFKSL